MEVKRDRVEDVPENTVILSRMRDIGGGEYELRCDVLDRFFRQFDGLPADKFEEALAKAKKVVVEHVERSIDNAVMALREEGAIRFDGPGGVV